MPSHLESASKGNDTAISDLIALFCHGGLVVQTSGGSETISVQSTIQLDGDITVSVTRSALRQPAILLSHVLQVESRIRKAIRLFRGTVWIAHGTLFLTVSIAWFLGLQEDPELDVHLSTITIWIGCSICSTAIVEYLLRTSVAQKSILSLIISGLSRFVN